MANPKFSKRTSRALSQALFLIGLAILFYVESWWPGIMLVIGLPLTLKQLLNGRPFDAALSLFVFIGFFIIANFDISWKVLMPILFMTSALYIVCREWVLIKTGEDQNPNDE